jgi:hypothetical protein
MLSTFGWGPGAVGLRDFRGLRPMPREAANMSQFGSVITALLVGAVRPGALLVALIGSAIALAGCARQDQQQAYAAAAPPPPPAYCQPSPSPDCEFRGPRLRAMDPGEFARLKHDYERRCIRRAERTDRERLRQLQTAGACPA